MGTKKIEEIKPPAPVNAEKKVFVPPPPSSTTEKKGKWGGVPEKTEDKKPEPKKKGKGW